MISRVVLRDLVIVLGFRELMFLFKVPSLLVTLLMVAVYCAIAVLTSEHRTRHLLAVATACLVLTALRTLMLGPLPLQKWIAVLPVLPLYIYLPMFVGERLSRTFRPAPSDHHAIYFVTAYLSFGALPAFSHWPPLLSIPTTLDILTILMYAGTIGLLLAAFLRPTSLRRIVPVSSLLVCGILAALLPAIVTTISIFRPLISWQLDLHQALSFDLPIIMAVLYFIEAWRSGRLGTLVEGASEVGRISEA